MKNWLRHVESCNIVRLYDVFAFFVYAISS